MTIKKLTKLFHLFNLYGIDYHKEDIYIYELLLLDDNVLEMLNEPIPSKISILETIRNSIENLYSIETDKRKIKI